MTNSSHLADDYVAAVNSHDLDRITGFFDEDMVDHSPFPGQPADAAGFRTGFGELTAAFPDLKLDLTQSIREGDRVALHYALSGTHLGDFAGIPATGRTFRSEAMDILELRRERITNHWGVIDVAAMFEQLGQGPVAEQGSAS